MSGHSRAGFFPTLHPHQLYLRRQSRELGEARVASSLRGRGAVLRPGERAILPMLSVVGWVILAERIRLGHAAAAASASTNYNYNYAPFPSSCGSDYDEYGPYCWASLNPTCGGSAQSPINLEYASPDKALHELKFKSPSCRAAKLFNDGHTYEIDTASTCPTFEVHFDDVAYHLESMQFRAPSEHTVSGAAHSAEMQLVHQDTAGNHLVISVLLDAVDDELARNNFVDFMWGFSSDSLDGISNSATGNIKAYATLADVSASHYDRDFSPYDEILPADPSYMTYTGSLTAPPCTEGITWVVMAQPVRVSVSQVRAFTFGMSNVTNATNFPSYAPGLVEKYLNSRPVQALGSRTVRFFSGAPHASHSSDHGSSHDDLTIARYTVILTPIARAFTFFGIIIMIIGGIASCYNMIVLLFNRVTGFKVRGLFFDVEEERTRPPYLALVREQIAVTIVISIDALVAADVCQTMAKPVHDLTFKELGLLSVVVVIRTALAMHLNHEMHDIHHDKHNEIVDAKQRQAKDQEKKHYENTLGTLRLRTRTGEIRSRGETRTESQQ